ncbi:MAG: hypothetical protein ACI4IV_02390 [Acutalibacteraceae bacterium]
MNIAVRRCKKVVNSLLWFWLALLIVEWAAIFVILYFLNKRTKRQSQIYSIIVSADSEIVPIQNITSALQMESSAVLKDIKSMSISGTTYPLLKHSHIDIGRQIIVISKDRLEKQRRKSAKINKKQSVADQTTIECKNCGATNKKGSNECEYCGSPL